MPPISTTDTPISLPAVARQLGTSMKLVNRLMKGCPVELEGRARVQWLLGAMGLEEGVGGWSEEGFWEKVEGGGKEEELKVEVAEEGMAELLERCPNPLWWRVKKDGRVEMMRELRGWMVGRLRVGLRVRVRKVRGAWEGC